MYAQLCTGQWHIYPVGCVPNLGNDDANVLPDVPDDIKKTNAGKEPGHWIQQCPMKKQRKKKKEG